MTPVELITQVGFPIVACIMLFRLYRDEKRAQREERQAFRESINELTAAFKALRSDVRRAPPLTDGGSDVEDRE